MLLDEFNFTISKGAYSISNTGTKNTGWIKESLMETVNDSFVPTIFPYIYDESITTLLTVINNLLNNNIEETVNTLFNNADLTDLTNENIQDYVEILYSEYLLSLETNL